MLQVFSASSPHLSHVTGGHIGSEDSDVDEESGVTALGALLVAADAAIILINPPERQEREPGGSAALGRLA